MKFLKYDSQILKFWTFAVDFSGQKKFTAIPNGTVVCDSALHLTGFGYMDSHLCNMTVAL
jgi:hypothetical protein